MRAIWSRTSGEGCRCGSSATSTIWSPSMWIWTCRRRATALSRNAGRDDPRHVGPQRRQQLEFKPGVALQPAVVPPRRMRHGHEARTVAGAIDVAPLADGFGQPGGDECRAEMPRLGVLADEQDELEIGQAMKQSLAPGLRAFAARRQVPAFGVETRKAESHRHDRNLHRIVEYLLADPEPLAQADAGRIGEGASRDVNPDARRLAGDAEARDVRDLEDGSRLMWQGTAVSR